MATEFRLSRFEEGAHDCDRTSERPGLATISRRMGMIVRVAMGAGPKVAGAGSCRYSIGPAGFPNNRDRIRSHPWTSSVGPASIGLKLCRFAINWYISI